MEMMLPWPPSVNQCFANVPGKGRVKTKAYKDWRYQAGWLIKISMAKAPKMGRYSVKIEATRQGKRRRDIDNFIKPIVDALVESGVVPDDCQMQHCQATWVAGLPDGQLKVKVEPWQEEP